MRNAVAGCSATGSGARAADSGGNAGHGLQQARAEQRHQHQVHAVQAAVNATVAAADHGLVAAEHRAQDSAIEAGTPGQRNARAEPAIERIVRVLARAAVDIADGRKADCRIVNLPCKAAFCLSIR